MDNENQTPAPSMNKFLIPAVVVGVIVIALIAFFVMGMGQNNSESIVQPTQEETAQATTAPSPTSEAVMGMEEEVMQAGYEDGEYSATGRYISPGGPRDVDVTVTIEDGVITDATFMGHATDPNSRRFQGEFKDNFEPEVVGKNIDEVELTKVAGSSLSPKGFMDALNQIKAEAQV